MDVNGHTKVVVHLAYPSTHLRTPSVFNPMCQDKNLNAILVPWQIKSGNLNTLWEGLRHCESLAGVIVTVPHKTAVAELCDELEGVAKLLGVANVARRTEDGRFIGRMYDGVGFLQGLKNSGYSVKEKIVLILGAGGAATGVAHALLEDGAKTLSITNRTVRRAESLARLLRTEFPQKDISVSGPNGQDYDIVINCTSLGLKEEDPLPIDIETINYDTLVADIIMQPDVTRLLQAAINKGCPTHKGVHMITGQTEMLANYLLK